MALEQIAQAHYRRSALTTQRVVAAVLAIWRATGPSGFRDELPRAAGLVAAGQLAQAVQAAAYLIDLADEQGLAAADAVLNPRSLSGVAANGRALVDVLSYPVNRTWQLLDAGADFATAEQSGLASLTRITGNEIDQAGITAERVGMVGHQDFDGYIRTLSGPSCGRCAILAGKWFKWDAGFDRHPQCFPAGVTVSGPATEAATRRWYEGELVVIRTASGKELPATANHPVLTSRGWVPAHFLQEGEDVVGSTGSQGAVALVVPDEQQMPTLIEDAFRSFDMDGLLQVPSAAEDFHGDGGHGNVDVVSADGLLRDRRESAIAQAVDQVLLASRSDLALSFAGSRSLAPLGLSVLASAGSGMGRRRLGRALFGSHLAGPHFAGVGHAANGYPGVSQPLADHRARNTVAEAEFVLTLAGLVRRRDVSHGQRDVSPRWDAPASPFSVESRGAYAHRGQDLALRLSSQVELDRVVEVRRVSWSGHVFNLTSSEGWYSANGLIVSNCDCKHVPAADRGDVSSLQTNPREYFNSLPKAEQDRLFGVAEADAIRGGTDISKAVNTGGLSTPRSIDRLVAGKSRPAAIADLTRSGYLTAA